ncbi:MAG: potassium transporter TrkG [Clostridia bacterium]
MSSVKIRKKPMETGLLITLGFLSIILFGALVLTLPMASSSGEWTSPFVALFTATSATCVTGLVLVDTYTHWSFFGQATILILIQVGGLGFMTIVTLFSMALRRRITFKERILMSSALNVTRTSGVVRLTKKILLGTVFFEGLGAIILATRFSSEFPLKEALWRGIFHSVSAFCNAGFDLMGYVEPFSSFTSYADDVVVNLTLMALTVIGGLGFFVWGDIYKKKRMSTHTRLVLLMTTVFIVGGTALFFVFEYNNPLTIGNMSLGDKILASSFQSVTTRTAGFNTISQGDLTSASLFLTYFFMFIGGSPGSTAGGVKTVTVAILFLAAMSTIQGKTTYNFAKRRINISAVLNAMSIFFMATFVISIATILMASVETAPFEFVVYEVISAFGTVGLSAGITQQLSTFSHILIIVLMFFGRVGILTLGFTLFMGKKEKSKINYPQGIILIG